MLKGVSHGFNCDATGHVLGARPITRLRYWATLTAATPESGREGASVVEMLHRESTSLGPGRSFFRSMRGETTGIEKRPPWIANVYDEKQLDEGGVKRPMRVLRPISRLTYGAFKKLAKWRYSKIHFLAKTRLTPPDFKTRE